MKRQADLISTRVSGEIQALSKKVESIQVEIRSISGRLTTLEQRELRPDTPADLFELASEIDRLRGRVESGGTEVMDAVRGLSQSQLWELMSLLGTLGSLIGKIERLALGAVPAVTNVAVRVFMSCPPPTQPQQPIQPQQPT